MADTTLDPRLNAFRPDLADARLDGLVTAERFTQGEPAQVAASILPVRRRPGPAEPLDTEAVFGERVTVFDVAGGWAWVQLAHDRYVGYVPVEGLTRTLVEPTHRVAAIGTFLYPAADIKAPPVMHLPLGAQLPVVELDERFARLGMGGFVVARHLVERTRFARDFVEVAERFIGTPYLWGGRTRIGLDCSGLVQISLGAAGIFAPRDSDMQQAGVGGEVLVPADLDGLERGDLVFWPGHVGIMIDGTMLLHANAHHMAVAVEPLVSAAARNAKAGSRVTAVRRVEHAAPAAG